MAAKYPLQPTPEEFIAMEPEEIRRHIAMGMVPPELSDEQLKQSPPVRCSHISMLEMRRVIAGLSSERFRCFPPGWSPVVFLMRSGKS